MPEPIVAYWEALPVWDTFGLKVLAALLLLWIAVWGWVWWPKRVAARLALDDPKARADVEDNFRKTVGQVLGGAVVLLGAGLAYLQFSQQQRAAHDLLISNQVSKGFEQMGSEKVVVRLGGIYALEGVMNNSDQYYYRSVLKALTAFVREGAQAKDVPLPTDVQAALTAIGTRSIDRGIGIDLINLSGANLTRANLFLANLFHANLGGTNLRDADLRHADLGGADLTGADLTGARIDQKQLDEACGSDAALPPGLTLKPCPPKSSP
jgi:uncharacterized protein YjbI with pentapeptide repeats